MARVTVQDCLQHVDNRFDLVLLATKRARQIAEMRLEMIKSKDFLVYLKTARELVEQMNVPATDASRSPRRCMT